MKLSFLSRVAAAAVAGSLVVLTLLPLATVALAQDAGAEAQEGTGRESEFVAMTGPAQESVSGGALMVAAYAVIWVLLCAYVGRLAMLQASTSKELARLDAALRARDDGEPAAGKTGKGK
jgi:CcmD family protein